SLELVEISLPIAATALDSVEKLVGRGFAEVFRNVALLHLLQENVQQVEIAVAQVHRGALVAVEVEHRGRVIRALTFEIVGVLRGRRNQRHERIDAFDRVIEHQPALRDYVMAAAEATAEQFHEVVTLAIDFRIAVEAVIGNNYERGVLRQGALLNRGPYLPDDRIHVLEDRELRDRVVVVMGDMIVVHQHQIEITDLRIGQLPNQLAHELIPDRAPHFKAHRPLVEQFLRRLIETILQAALEGRVAYAALIQRRRQVALFVSESIGQYWQAQR